MRESTSPQNPTARNTHHQVGTNSQFTAVKLYKKETEMMRGKNTPVKESELTRLNREIEENIVVGDGRGKRGIYKKDEK